MIKFEYIPWTAERTWGYAEDVPPVESVTMTLGGDVSWEEAVCEFHNFLRAAGYVIPYDFEDDYVDCSDPPDMDKSGSLGDRQPEWANRMSGPDKWWHQSNTGVASEDQSNTGVADIDEMQDLIEALGEAVYLLNPTDEDMQKKAGVYRVVKALEKLREKNT